MQRIGSDRVPDTQGIYIYMNIGARVHARMRPFFDIYKFTYLKEKAFTLQNEANSNLYIRI